MKKKTEKNHLIHIKKGLDIPLKGSLETEDLSLCDTVYTKKIALTGLDYVGIRPNLMVKEGDVVRKGAPLFSDKKNKGVLFTAPATGKVLKINRGARRVLHSVEIEVDQYGDDQIEFKSCKNDVRKLLIESGLWTSFRTRPYSKIPDVGSCPDAIFITATDTNPLAMNPDTVISENKEHFLQGVEYISRLTVNKTYVCCGEKLSFSNFESENVEIRRFKGVHPAGNVGTHIHYISPVSEKKTVWHINYQDVIAIGMLSQTKKLWTDRFISLVGPGAKQPCIIKTCLGADVQEISDRYSKGPSEKYRIISGSILNGRTVEKDLQFLGSFHSQVCIFEEGGQREFLGWMLPGFNKFSLTRTFFASLFRRKRFALKANLNGGSRSIVPIGMYEKVMPLDILPTQLLIALTIGDLDQAVDLGCLELDEEDLALCTFVCPSKIDFAPLLRNNLTLIEKEG